MFNNVGRFDQIVRLLLAEILLYAGLSVYQDTGLVVGFDIAAAVLAFSAAIGFCGIYSLLGINTRQPHDHPPA